MNFIQQVKTLTSDEKLSRFRESLYTMREKLWESMPVMDILSDLEPGDVLDSDELEHLRQSIDDRGTMLIETVDKGTVAIGKVDDTVVNIFLSSDGVITGTETLINELGEVVGTVKNTQSIDINFEDVIDSVNESEAVISGLNLLTDLEKEGTLTMAAFRSSLESLENAEVLKTTVEFEHMLTAAQRGSSSHFVDVMSYVANRLGQDKDDKSDLGFADATYQPFRFIPISWSTVGDLISTAISVAFSIVSPILGLAAYGISKAVTSAIKFVRDTEDYRFNPTHTSKRYALPLMQLITNRNDSEAPEMHTVNKYGMVKFSHVNLEMFSWSVSTGETYHEMYPTFELYYNPGVFIRPAIDQPLNLSIVKNNISDLQSYEEYVTPVTDLGAMSSIEIEKSLASSLIIALRLVMRDGQTVRPVTQNNFIYSVLDVIENGGFQVNQLLSDFRTITTKLSSEDYSYITNNFGITFSEPGDTGHRSSKLLYGYEGPYDWEHTDVVDLTDSRLVHGDIVKVNLNSVTTGYSDLAVVPRRSIIAMVDDRADAETRANQWSMKKDAGTVTGGGVLPHGSGGSYAYDRAIANGHVVLDVSFGYWAATQWNAELALSKDDAFRKWFPSAFAAGMDKNQGSNSYTFLVRYKVHSETSFQYWYREISWSPPGVSSDFIWKTGDRGVAYYEIVVYDYGDTSGEFQVVSKSINDAYDRFIEPDYHADPCISPPTFVPGTWIKYLGAALVIASTIAVTAVVYKRTRASYLTSKHARLSSRLTNAQNQFESDPTRANFRRLTRAQNKYGKFTRSNPNIYQALGRKGMIDELEFAKTNGFIDQNYMRLRTVGTNVDGLHTLTTNVKDGVVANDNKLLNIAEQFLPIASTLTGVGSDLKTVENLITGKKE